jgi:hypothetical protein
MYPREREYTVRVSPGVPANIAAAAATAVDEMPPPGSTIAKCSASIDFASVVWYGQHFAFTPTQRRIVAVLWNAWERGTPDIGERSLLTEADSDSPTLKAVFGKHPAIGTMISRSSQHGGPAGCFRLTEPRRED